MKIFKILLTILLLGLSVQNTGNSSYAAEPGIVGKIAAKKSAKSAAKKQVEKKFAKELAEKSLKKSTPSIMVKKIPYITTITAAEKKEFTSKGVKEFMEEDVEKVMKEFGEAAVRKGGKELASNAMTKSVREYTSRIARKDAILAERKEMIDLSRKELSEKIGKESSEKLSKNESERVTKNVIKGASDELSKKIGPAATDYFRKICGKDADKYYAKLLEDVAGNKELAKAISKRPELLNTYLNLIESDVRKDVTILRYFNYGASKYAQKLQRLAGKYGDGTDLIIKTEGGVNRIYKKGTGAFLGTIEGDARKGYTVICSEEERTLLNLYSLKNTTYKCGPNTWKTDEYGKVIYARSEIVGPLKKVEGRDKQLQRDVVTLKNGYDVNGNAVKRRKGFNPNDDEGGHIIALQNGGTNDMINIVPQSAKMNRNYGGKTVMDKLWRESEKQLNDKIKDKNVGVVVSERWLEYPDKIGQRPSSIKIRHTADGKVMKYTDPKTGSVINLDAVEIMND